jgi:hypothetical protein
VVLQDGRLVLRTATTLYTLDASSYATLGQADIGVTERGQAITQAIDTAQVLTAAGPSGAVSTGTAIPGPAPATPQNPATRTANPQTQATTAPRGEPHLRPDGHDRFGRDRRRAGGHRRSRGGAAPPLRVFAEPRVPGGTSAPTEAGYATRDLRRRCAPAPSRCTP